MSTIKHKKLWLIIQSYCINLQYLSKHMPVYQDTLATVRPSFYSEAFLLTALFCGVRTVLSCLVFNAERVILCRVQVLAPMALKPRPIPMPAEICYSLRSGRGGSLDCMWGVQTHSGPQVFLVSFRKDLARMNGTPQPNRKWLPALGIEPGSLDHESQSLTIWNIPDSLTVLQSQANCRAV